MTPTPPPKQSPPSPQQAVKYALPLSAVIGVGLVIILAIVCALGVLGPMPSLHGLKSPTATCATRAIPTPSATLGGTLGDFVQRYGNSVDESGLMYAATLAGQRVLIVVTLDEARQSRDGREHVIVVDVQVPGDALGTESWSVAMADTIAQMFLPVDAQFQRIASSFGETYHLYHSDMLAATFLPGQYTNMPGSLNYSCHVWPPMPSSSGYGQCHIAIGSDDQPPRWRISQGSVQ
jgi:hypothetical protein